MAEPSQGGGQFGTTAPLSTFELSTGCANRKAPLLAAEPPGTAAGVRGDEERPVLPLNAAVHKPEAELRSALDGLLSAGLLFSQGVPPHATYLFKHALVQDAALAPYCASGDALCMLALVKRLSVNSPKSPRINLNFWRTIALRPG